MKKIILTNLVMVFSLFSFSVSSADSDIGLRLSPQKKFVFKHLSAGSKIIGDKVFYEDFFIAAAYFGYKDVTVKVRLTSEDGFDFTYGKNTLGQPLKILAGEVKRTVILNVVGLAIPFEEYHEGITVEIDADRPIYVVPPKLFSTSAVGGYDQSDAEALERDKRAVIEKAWEKFGSQVPVAHENFHTIFGAIEYAYAPYLIFWRNLKVFPNGWDTKVTLKNTAENRESRLKIFYLPDYNFRHGKKDCAAVELGAPAALDVYLSRGETKTFFLSELLGETLESSHQTEGSLWFYFINPYVDNESVAGHTEINVEVVPLLTGGQRICDLPPTP